MNFTLNKENYEAGADPEAHAHILKRILMDRRRRAEEKRAEMYRLQLLTTIAENNAEKQRMYDRRVRYEQRMATRFMMMSSGGVLAFALFFMFFKSSR